MREPARRGPASSKSAGTLRRKRAPGQHARAQGGSAETHGGIEIDGQRRKIPLDMFDRFDPAVPRFEFQVSIDSRPDIRGKRCRGGGEGVASIHTPIETATLDGIDPETYLRLW